MLTTMTRMMPRVMMMVIRVMIVPRDAADDAGNPRAAGQYRYV
jgi:hypothetical protein